VDYKVDVQTVEYSNIYASIGGVVNGRQTSASGIRVEDVPGSATAKKKFFAQKLAEAYAKSPEQVPGESTVTVSLP